MRVAVLQSNYIPWRGYFSLIAHVEHFVFYDDVQYTKNDWRNRNRIKGQNGPMWLTIPVGAHLDQRICDVAIPNERWQIKHWKSISQSYSKAPHWSIVERLLRPVFLEMHWQNLSTLNQFLIKKIATDFLGLRTAFDESRRFNLTGSKLDRLLELLRQVGATEYLSGPSAASYIDEKRFVEAGIDLSYHSYSDLVEYPQLYPPFDPNVSIIDLLAMTGTLASDFV